VFPSPRGGGLKTRLADSKPWNERGSKVSGTVPIGNSRVKIFKVRGGGLVLRAKPG